MRDDYLWDGSGSPDPEIEKLEGLLGRYRSERPAPELPETPVVPFRPRRAVLLPYAAAAAVAVLSLSLGLWYAVTRQQTESTLTAEGVPANRAIPIPGPGDGSTDAKPAPPPPPNTKGEEKSTPPVRQLKPKKVAPKDEAAPQLAVKPEPKLEPLLDLATATHLEQAELLLRSFKNVRADDRDSLAEVAFDSRQSKELLDQNAVLRRTAEAKRNLPVGQLLDDLEPFLMDIANLGAKPSSDDIREIQQRIERREIVSDIELYSANRPAQGF